MTLPGVPYNTEYFPSSNSFASSSLSIQLNNDTALTPVVEIYENILFFVYNRMKSLFLMRSIKTFKFKNTTDLLIIAHACEGN
jgi:hypothetical protein